MPDDEESQQNDLLDYALIRLKLQSAAKSTREEAISAIQRQADLYGAVCDIDLPRKRDVHAGIEQVASDLKRARASLEDINEDAFVWLFGSYGGSHTQQYDQLCSILKQIDGRATKILNDDRMVDRGGGAEKPADDHLVAGCVDIFEQYRPGESASTDGGDFSVFVNLVAEIGNGRETNLIWSIRKTIKLLKDEKPKDEELDE